MSLIHLPSFIFSANYNYFLSSNQRLASFLSSLKTSVTLLAPPLPLVLMPFYVLALTHMLLILLFHVQKFHDLNHNVKSWRIRTIFSPSSNFPFTISLLKLRSEKHFTHLISHSIRIAHVNNKCHARYYIQITYNKDTDMVYPQF